ncbi:MAG TPA: HNH endonuclease signature motif containing protein, partial [Trebonia sp.]
KKLGHLTRARNATCPAPGCGASSWHSDMDHTEPWPAGPTCECNIGLPCRHHHRTKQAPGWKLAQPEPGTFRWTTPSGRVYETRPTKYDT